MNGKLSSHIHQIFWSKFRFHCHQGVIEGYKAMLANPSGFKQWQEEKISARLLYEMKRLQILKSKNIIVGRESHLEDEEILFGEKEAQDADRIDFIFSNTWKQKEYLEYFGEAKNLSHKDWVKKSGAKVSASQYRARYIDTGIAKIITGGYSRLDSFLIGYVVNDTAKNNVTGINSLIKKRKILPNIGLIENQKPICSHQECYSSKNFRKEEEVILQHIFLEFDT